VAGWGHLSQVFTLRDSLGVFFLTEYKDSTEAFLHTSWLVRSFLSHSFRLIWQKRPKISCNPFIYYSFEYWPLRL